MQSALEKRGWDVSNTELQRLPLNSTALDVENAKKVMKLIDKMEEMRCKCSLPQFRINRRIIGSNGLTFLVNSIHISFPFSRV